MARTRYPYIMRPAAVFVAPLAILAAACSGQPAEPGPPPPKPVATAAPVAKPAPPPAAPAGLAVPDAFAGLFVDKATWRYEVETLYGQLGEDDVQRENDTVTCTVVEVVKAPARVASRIECTKRIEDVVGVWVVNEKGLWHDSTGEIGAAVSQLSDLQFPLPLVTSKREYVDGTDPVVLEIAQEDGRWCRRKRSGGEDSIWKSDMHLCLSGAAPLSGDREVVDQARGGTQKVKFVPAK
jgi:hypothetical protein